MAEVRATLQNIAAQLDNINGWQCIKMRANMVLIKDTVQRLIAVCTDSRDTSSKNRNHVRDKANELEAKFRQVH